MIINSCTTNFVEVLHGYTKDAAQRHEYKLNFYGLLLSVATRVQYIAITLFAITAAPVCGLIDTCTIIRDVRRHWNGSLLTILKVGIHNAASGAIGFTQLALNIICPELMLTNTFDLHKAMANAIGHFAAYGCTSFERLCEVGNICPRLLPSQEVPPCTPGHLRAEICEFIKQDTALIHDPCTLAKKFLELHYKSISLKYAHKNFVTDPAFEYATTERTDVVLEQIRQGKRLDQKINEVSLFEFMGYTQTQLPANRDFEYDEFRLTALKTYLANQPVEHTYQAFLDLWLATKHIVQCRNTLMAYGAFFCPDKILNDKICDLICSDMLDNNFDLDELWRQGARIGLLSILLFTSIKNNEATPTENSNLQRKECVQKFLIALLDSNKIPNQNKRFFYEALNPTNTKDPKYTSALLTQWIAEILSKESPNSKSASFNTLCSEHSDLNDTFTIGATLFAKVATIHLCS